MIDLMYADWSEALTQEKRCMGVLRQAAEQVSSWHWNEAADSLASAKLALDAMIAIVAVQQARASRQLK